MVKYKGVMFLSEDSESWRRHNEHHAYLSRVNSKERAHDEKFEVTQLVEELVRQELALHFTATKYRVLRWEQLDSSNRYGVHYRELDGVFKLDNGYTVLLEVKASASKTSLKKGLQQLRSVINIATQTNQKIIGLLVVGDLGEFLDDFGEAPMQPLADYLEGKNLNLLAWPPKLSDFESGLFGSIIPGEIISKWIS